MATVANTYVDRMDQPRGLSGTPFARAVDRWIYVFTAASFIVVTFTGFIPDSLMKIEMVKAGLRPPFPIVLHMHAVLMGTFLMLLLTQTVLVANGRCDLHRRVGLGAMVVVPLLVVVGFVLVPTMYAQVWHGAQAQPDNAGMQALLSRVDDIALLQLRIGVLFPLFIAIGLRARGRNAGFHKRMMILATAMAMPAAIDRITWLPHTIPESPVSPDLYVLAIVAPMFIWDVIRNRGVHKAYWVWLAVNIPFAIAVHSLWDTPWWHANVPHLMGVA